MYKLHQIKEVAVVINNIVSRPMPLFSCLAATKVTLSYIFIRTSDKRVFKVGFGKKHKMGKGLVYSVIVTNS